MFFSGGSFVAQFEASFFHTNYLQFLDNHEAEQTVEPVEAKCTQCVLDLREKPVIGDFLVVLQVIPGVHLVNVARHPVKRLVLGMGDGLNQLSVVFFWVIITGDFCLFILLMPQKKE